MQTPEETQANLESLNSELEVKEARSAELDNLLAEKESKLQALSDSIEAGDVENDRLTEEIKARSAELEEFNSKLVAAGKAPIAPVTKSVQGNLVLSKNRIFLNGKTIEKEDFTEEHFAQLVEAYDGDADKAIAAHMVQVK